MYRNFLYLNKLSKTRRAVRAGRLSESAARDVASRASARLMQDFDGMLPIERELFQRVFPFWNWKRSLIRHALTYPLDHPFRTTTLNWAAREAEERKKVSEFVDRLLEHMLPVGQPSAKGYQLFLSLRGMNPFADYSNMGTLAGWLQSVHPLASGLMRAVGYEPLKGGIPEYAPDASVTTDAFGNRVREPDWWGALWETVPQGRAVRDWLEGKSPPPDTETLDGALDWLDRYGASLRVIPGLSYYNVPEMEKKYQEKIRRHGALESGQLQSILVPTKGTSHKELVERGILRPSTKPSNKKKRSGSRDPYRSRDLYS
jgi:hypothetical protein